MKCTTDGWVLLNQEEGSYSRGPLGSTSLDYNQFNGVFAYFYVSPKSYVVITYDEDGEKLRVCSTMDLVGADFDLMSKAIAYIENVLHINVSEQTSSELIATHVEEELKRT